MPPTQHWGLLARTPPDPTRMKTWKSHLLTAWAVLTSFLLGFALAALLYYQAPAHVLVR